MMYISRWVLAVSDYDFSDANVIHRNLIHISCSNGSSITDIVYGPASGVVAAVTLSHNDQEYHYVTGPQIAEDLNIEPESIPLSEKEILEKISLVFQKSKL